MIQDILSGASKVSMLTAQTITGNGTDTLSSAADLQGFEGGGLITVQMGNSGDTLATDLNVQLEVQESADDSTYTAVADSDLVGFVDGTNDGTFALVDAPAEDSTAFYAQYVGSKRYVKVNVNLTGNHATGVIIGISCLRLKYKYAPV